MAWLSGWTYRKSITLSRASGAVTNYQMKLLVGESSGATGEDVDCNSHILSAFDDLRFTTDDGTTLLDYWIESITGTTPNRLATVWIEFGTIGTGATTFYMYYGKASAAAVSSGANTFIVFDDFERGADGDTIGGSWTETAAHVHISTDHAYGGSRCAKLVGAAAGPNATIPVTAADTIALRYRLWKETAVANFQIAHGDGTHQLYSDTGATATEDIRYYNDASGYVDTGVNLTPDQWELMEFRNFIWASQTMDIIHNGVLIGDGISINYNSSFAQDIFRIAMINDAAGRDAYIDDFIVRNFRETEPAWGSWGTEAVCVLKAITGTAAVSTVGTVSRTKNRLKALAVATATAVGTVVRRTGRALSGTVDSVGTVSRALIWWKAIATATASTVGSVARSTGKALEGLAATVGTMRPLTVGKALEGASSALGSVARVTAKTIATATVDTVGTLIRGMLIPKAIATATVAAVGSVGRAIGRTITGTSATVGSVARDMTRAITGTVSAIGTVPRAITKAVAAGTVATVGSLIRGMVYTKAIAAGIVSTVGTVVRQTGQVLSATATAVGLSIRPLTVGKVPEATVSTVGTMRPISVTRAITGAVGTVGTARRGIARTIATAVVSTVGTIWATAGQLISAGASVVASVSRRVYRNITGTVGTIGTITDFLYDIVYAMNQTFRKIYAKVRITYTDPYFSAGVATAADAVGDYTYTDQTVDNVTTEEYKWFSLHRNDLGGTFHPLPGDQSISVGWWGTQLSDFVTHSFVPTYPQLTITHASRIVERVLVVGDDKLNEYPVDFTVKLYSTGSVLEHTQTVTGNAAVIYDMTLSPSHAGIVKQVLQITKWSRGDSVSKIAQFFTTLEQTYLSEDGDIVSLNMTEQREFTGTTIPQGNLASSEITVKLNNIDGVFDPGNPDSPLYGQLLNNRAITAWLGVDLVPSGVRRWYPLGTFYSRDWSAPDSEIYAEVSGQDMLARLQATTYSAATVFVGATLQAIAIAVLTDAGLTSADWDIDPAFNAITVPYAWFESVSHRECLRKIAAAALGQCYCDRDGKIVLEVYQAPTLNPFAYTSANTFTFDHPLQWSQMINYVEAQANPRVPSAEVNIVTDVEVITVPAGGTVTKLHYYSFSPCIDVQAPVIVGGADITVSAWTAYSWCISVTYANAGGGAETVTQVTVAGKMLEVQGSRVVVAQDADSIAQNGKQTLSEPISSEFWQDETRAQAVADSILTTFRNPRRDIVMRARGNIAQLLGDRVQCVDSWYAATTAQYGIVGQDVSYDGGLEITVTAQQLGVRTDKTLAAVVSTVGTVTRTRPTLKTIATATVSAIGSIPRRTGKALTAVASTVGSMVRKGIDFEAEAGSGYLNCSKTSFAAVYAATSADTVEYVPFAQVGQYHSATAHEVDRGFGIFATGDRIGAGDTITSAELWMYVSWKLESRTWNLVIQNGQPTYPHDPLVVGDFDQTKYAGDGGSVAVGTLTAGAWNKIDLNATGLTWIQKGAGNKTKLCLRSDRDINADGPGSYGSEYLGCSAVNIAFLRVHWTV